jgi:hypothetical protein
METTDGTDPVQVSYEEGYFRYECGNINVSFGRRNKQLWIHVHLGSTIITCILQLSIISQPLLHM